MKEDAMAVLYSSMSGIGSDMPDFKLGSFDGTEVLRDNLLGAPAILVIFMGSENPYIHHVREVLVKLVWQFQQKGVVAVAINSDDLESTPEECLGNMKLDAQKYG